MRRWQIQYRYIMTMYFNSLSDKRIRNIDNQKPNTTIMNLNVIDCKCICIAQTKIEYFIDIIYNEFQINFFKFIYLLNKV